MKPLEGIRVLDIATYIAAPYCATIMAEFGAEVIRIDPPAPQAGPFATMWFGIDVNQGKRAIILDLKTEAGRQAVAEMLVDTDVVLHNFLDRSAESLGIDYASLKALKPEIRVIGVQTDDSDAMAQSIAAGEIVELDDVGLFSDGTAVRRVGEETFGLVQQHVDEILRVDTDAACAAIKDVFADTRAILEPAGALAIAGLKQYSERDGVADQTLVAIACGANMNFDRLGLLPLRPEQFGLVSEVPMPGLLAADLPESLAVSSLESAE